MPLLEAMALGVPVIARAAGAVARGGRRRGADRRRGRSGADLRTAAPRGHRHGAAHGAARAAAACGRRRSHPSGWPRVCARSSWRPPTAGRLMAVSAERAESGRGHRRRAAATAPARCRPRGAAHGRRGDRGGPGRGRGPHHRSSRAVPVGAARSGAGAWSCSASAATGRRSRSCRGPGPGGRVAVRAPARRGAERAGVDRARTGPGAARGECVAGPRGRRGGQRLRGCGARRREGAGPRPPRGRPVRAVWPGRSCRGRAGRSSPWLPPGGSG